MSSILKNLKTQRDKLKKELAIIEKAITDLEIISNGDFQEIDTQTIPLELDTPKYKPEWSMKNKIKFFLQQERRFLHASELAMLINNKDNTNIKTLPVSVALNRLLKDTENSNGRIINVKHNDNLRNAFWGLHAWLIADEQRPKNEHMFNKDFLWENRKEEITIE